MPEASKEPNAVSGLNRALGKRAKSNREQVAKDRFAAAEQNIAEPITEALVPLKPEVIAKPVEKKKPESRVKRHIFTLTKEDEDRLEAADTRALSVVMKRNKSELIRAGLLMLERASDEDFVKALESIELIRTRRKKSEST